MRTLHTVPAHRAQIHIHHAVYLLPSSVSCFELYSQRRLVHACASRLKLLTPATVEDTSAEEHALDVLDINQSLENLYDKPLLNNQSSDEVHIAATDCGSSCQQCPDASNIPSFLHQLGDDWTESNDEDIRNAMTQLVRRVPKPAAQGSRKPSSSSSSSSTKSSALLPHQLLGKPLRQQDEHNSDDRLAAARANPAAATAAGATATATAEDEGTEPGLLSPGSFFASRATLLTQLQQQQLQMQRQVLLQKQRKNLYTYELSASGEVTKIRRPGLKSPLEQTEFKLAKVRQRADAPSTENKSSSSSSSWSTSTDDMAVPANGSTDGLSNASKNSTVPAGNAAGVQLQQQQQQQQQRLQIQQQQQQQRRRLQMQQQWSELPDVEDVPTTLQQTPVSYLSSSSSSTGSTGHSGSSSSAGSTNRINSAGNTSSTGSATDDPSRGLCLSAFLYCCTRSTLLTLTWQLGLPPGALKFVSKVSDADMVLHVKPKRGEKHYQYDDFRQQAAAKGIPFIDLKNLSLQELQLYLLPVYALYAGEVSPRDLLQRKKRRGWKRRYTNIKLPPA